MEEKAARDFLTNFYDTFHFMTSHSVTSVCRDEDISN